MFGSAGNDARLVRPPALGTALAAVPFLAIIAGVRYDCVSNDQNLWMVLGEAA
ncbi:hypothetical protein [Rhodococcus sp. ADH]|uniref:hypothetical protein n=1 Tax=Rhodococcus sp. ADH TaxID=224843 RepID=UPI000AD74A72|nr:hypothetical protein [Rhodococcus sp. ADH]